MSDELKLVHIQGPLASVETILCRLLETTIAKRETKYLWAWTGQASVPRTFGVVFLDFLNNGMRNHYQDLRTWLRMLLFLWTKLKHIQRLCSLEHGRLDEGKKKNHLHIQFSIVYFLLLWQSGHQKRKKKKSINQQRISLVPQSESDFPSIGLFYTKDEFEDVVSRKLEYLYPEDIDIERDVLGHIFAVTDSHLGAVHSIIAVNFRVCAYFKLSWYIRATLTNYFRNITTLSSINGSPNGRQHCSVSRRHRQGFQSVKGSVHRSFPRITSLKDEATEFSTRIAKEGNVPFNLQYSRMKMCYQNGWSHRVALDDGIEVAVLP